MSNAVRDWLAERFLEKRQWGFRELRKLAPEWLPFGWMESELRLLEAERKVSFPSGSLFNAVLIAVPGWPEPGQHGGCSGSEEKLAAEVRKSEFLRKRLFDAYFEEELEGVDGIDDESFAVQDARCEASKRVSSVLSEFHNQEFRRAGPDAV